MSASFHPPGPYRPLAPQGLGLDGVDGVVELEAAVRLAAEVTQTPTALLAVAGDSDVRALACHGLDAAPAGLESALCAAAQALDEPLVVPDLWLDPRFADHARAAGDARARSGVAIALRVRGQAPATLCVLDRRVRDFDAGQLGALADVAALTRCWFEANRAALDARDQRTCSQALVLNVGDALRPQLDIISGHSHALQLDAEAALAPRVLRHLDKLRQAAQRVGKLFEDLSRLIRDQAAEAGAGRDAARPRGVDLDVVARHAITLHEAQARDSGVILRHVAWPEPVRADAELSAVLQVISELLANGIAFNLRDATLTLETSVRDGRACLAFIDEGLGLSESQRARLFDPLAQPAPADPGRDADRGGLGLVIARAMACAMGGEIRVASRPGAGSMFTLELTLQHAPFAARGGAAQPGPETQADASTST